MVSIAPIEPIDQPELPKPSPPRGRSLGLEALFGLIVAAVVVALGAPVGLLWSWIAPKVELVQTPGGPYPIDNEPEGYFADDGWFMIIGAATGVLIAVAAWIILRRYRGPFILAGLVIGSAAAAALAAWLGNKIGYAHYLDLVEHAPVDTHIFRPAKVRAGDASLWHGVIPWVRGSLLIQALVAAVVYTCLAGFHASPTLTYDLDPAVDPYHPGYPPGASVPGFDLGAAAPGHHPGAPAFGYPQPGASPFDPAQPVPGQPGYVQPGSGQTGALPGYAQPGSNLPGHAQPGHAQSGYGQPGYGQPAPGESPAGDGAAGRSGHGQDAFGSSAGDQAPQDQPVNGQPHGGPAQTRPDLRKQAPGATGSAQGPADPDRDDWRAP